jgi:transposase-like protein
MSQTTESNRRRWVEIIARQRASGLGVGRFCRREGLAPSTFFAWRRRLGEAGGHQAPGGVVGHGASHGGKNAHGAAFVEVVAASEAAESCDDGVTASGVEVCLGNGRRIGVARSFDPQTLCRVLAVLEQMPGLPAMPSAEQGVRT